jgi:hypothetical protein
LVDVAVVVVDLAGVVVVVEVVVVVDVGVGSATRSAMDAVTEAPGASGVAVTSRT